jgi:hypothetical protein
MMSTAGTTSRRCSGEEWLLLSQLDSLRPLHCSGSTSPAIMIYLAALGLAMMSMPVMAFDSVASMQLHV